MIEYTEKHKVSEGTPLVATGVRTLPELTEGKIYTAIQVHEGIFSSRPFVTVLDDLGKEYTCHLSRFSFVEVA